MNPTIQARELTETAFSALVDQSLAGVYIIQGGHFRYANERLREIFGCTEADLAGFDDFLAWAVDERDRATVKENVRRRLAGEVRSMRYDIRCHRRDGTAIQVEVHGSLAEYRGEPAIVGILLDITERLRAERALATEHQFIASVLDTVGALVVVLDRQGRIVRFNRECERVSGYQAQEMLGRVVWECLLLPEETEAVQSVFRQLTGGGFPNRHENHWVARDGTRRLIDWTNTALLDDDGRVEYLIGTGIDITERRQAEDALRESEAMLREITSELGDGIYVLDRAGRLTFMNRAAERMLGWQEAELAGRNAHMAFHFQLPDGSFVAVEECPVHMAIHSDQTYRAQEDWFTRKDGSLFPVSFVATPLHRGNEVVGSVAAFQDITERLESEQRIRHLALHDMLTGLPNRVLLADRMERVLAHARRGQGLVALLYLDLDGFKQVNDRLGHDAGDTLLQQVAGRLARTVREADTVARTGGDEFVILLTGIKGEAGPVRVAGKVIEAVNRPIEIGAERLQIGVSIGIALYPAHGGDGQTLMKHADMAMYQAKAAGRNGYRYYEAVSVGGA